jgi:hypothetical protein
VVGGVIGNRGGTDVVTHARAEVLGPRRCCWAAWYLQEESSAALATGDTEVAVIVDVSSCTTALWWSRWRCRRVKRAPPEVS